MSATPNDEVRQHARRNLIEDRGRHRLRLLLSLKRQRQLAVHEAEHVGVEGGERVRREPHGESAAAQATEHGVVVRERDGPGVLARLQHAQRPAMAQQHLAHRAHAAPHGLLPVERGVRHLDLAEHEIHHAVENRLLVGEVVIERHRLHAQLLGSARYDVILDVGGNHPLARLRRAMRPNGRLVFVGGENGGDWTAGFERQIAALLRAPFTKQRFVVFAAREHHSFFERVAALASEGVRPIIDHRVSLADVPAAIRDLEAGRVLGKVVVAVGANSR